MSQIENIYNAVQIWLVAYLWSGTPQPVKQKYNDTRISRYTLHKHKYNRRKKHKSGDIWEWHSCGLVHHCLSNSQPIHKQAQILTSVPRSSSKSWTLISESKMKCCLTIRTSRNFVGKNILWQSLPTAKICSWTEMLIRKYVDGNILILGFW